MIIMAEQLEFYFPKSKAKHMSIPTQGKAYPSKGGSIRWGVQAIRDGGKSLPKFVTKEKYETYGFSVKNSETVGHPTPANPLEEVPAILPSPAEPTNESFNAKQIRREPQYQLEFDSWPLKIHVEHCPMNPFRRGGGTFTPKEIAQKSYTILYNHESLPQFEGNTFGELRKASSGLIVPCNCTINEMKVVKELDPATFTREPDETQEHWDADEMMECIHCKIEGKENSMFDYDLGGIDGCLGCGDTMCQAHYQSDAHRECEGFIGDHNVYAGSFSASGEVSVGQKKIQSRKDYDIENEYDTDLEVGEIDLDYYTDELENEFNDKLVDAIRESVDDSMPISDGETGSGSVNVDTEIDMTVPVSGDVNFDWTSNEENEEEHEDDEWDADFSWNAESETFEATAYSMIEYQDDNCLEEIADSLRPKYGLEYNEGVLEWGYHEKTGNMILYIYDGDNFKLDAITYDRKALAKALKEQGHKNPESWGAEMEDLTDGVSAITNRFGDSVGIVQVDDSDDDIEDVEVQIIDDDMEIVYEDTLGAEENFGDIETVIWDSKKNGIKGANGFMENYSFCVYFEYGGTGSGEWDTECYETFNEALAVATIDNSRMYSKIMLRQHIGDYRYSAESFNADRRCIICKGSTTYGEDIGDEESEFCGNCNVLILPNDSDRFKVSCSKCGFGDPYFSTEPPCEICEPIAEQIETLNVGKGMNAPSFNAESKQKEAHIVSLEMWEEVLKENPNDEEAKEQYDYWYEVVHGGRETPHNPDYEAESSGKYDMLTSMKMALRGIPIESDWNYQMSNNEYIADEWIEYTDIEGMNKTLSGDEFKSQWLATLRKYTNDLQTKYPDAYGTHDKPIGYDAESFNADEVELEEKYKREFIDEYFDFDSNPTADTQDEETIELAYQTWLYNKENEEPENHECANCSKVVKKGDKFYIIGDSVLCVSCKELEEYDDIIEEGIWENDNYNADGTNTKVIIGAAGLAVVLGLWKGKEIIGFIDNIKNAFK